MAAASVSAAASQAAAQTKLIMRIKSISLPDLMVARDSSIDGDGTGRACKSENSLALSKWKKKKKENATPGQR